MSQEVVAHVTRANGEPVCALKMPGQSTVREIKREIEKTPEGEMLMSQRFGSGNTLIRLLHGERLLADDGCILSSLLEDDADINLVLICVPETEEVRAVRAAGFGVKTYLQTGTGSDVDPKGSLRDACRNDKEAMMIACQTNCTSLEMASEELRGDVDLVTAAVRSGGGALQYASPQLRGSLDIVLDAIAKNGKWLRFADDHLKADSDVVLVAVKKSGSALKYAADCVKADRDVVLAAVEQDGLALREAPAFHADREIVDAAIRQNALALQFADPILCADKDLVLIAVGNRGSALQFASDTLKKDPDVVRVATELDPLAHKFVLK